MTCIKRNRYELPNGWGLARERERRGNGRNSCDDDFCLSPACLPAFHQPFLLFFIFLLYFLFQTSTLYHRLSSNWLAAFYELFRKGRRRRRVKLSRHVALLYTETSAIPSVGRRGGKRGFYNGQGHYMPSATECHGFLEMASSKAGRQAGRPAAG